MTLEICMKAAQFHFLLKIRLNIRGRNFGALNEPLDIQGASGIVARFLKLSPASAISPIMTKFSQYTPHSTCYLVLVFICWQD
jgi:hypothetical protein